MNNKFKLLIFNLALYGCKSDDDCTCSGVFERLSGEIIIAENVNCSDGLRDDAEGDNIIVGQEVGTFLGCE